MTRDLLQTALDAADAAGAVHQRYRERLDSFRTVEKGQSDFVSEVDLEAQEAALSVIRSRHPGHQIRAEEDEHGASLLRSAGAEVNHSAHGPAGTGSDVPTWIVDPLDGTTNYLHGHPMFASSVGVALGPHVVAGAVLAVATGERWWASRGGGAFLNGQPIRVSTQRELRGALIGTGFPFKSLPLLPRYLQQMDNVLRNTAGIRRLGSAALDLCYLATGRLDAFWELQLGAWDVAAGLVIVEEAGGIVTDVDGFAIELVDSGSYLAANSPTLHEALRGLVRQADVAADAPEEPGTQ
jgi:myo-inositol-1(or 4)-monophosphatase